MAAERPAVTIVVVYPELMGTYGDGGNAIALRERCTRRGLDAAIIEVHAPDPVPRDADIYLIGGAENASQTTAARLLKDEGGLVAAVARGASVLGICGGYQVLGESITDADGVTTAGLGLLDVHSSPLPARAVGDIAVTPSGLQGVERAAVPALVGFENHAYGTALGPKATPLGTVVGGIGNGLPATATPPVTAPAPATEGAVQHASGAGVVIGTYLHGPLLALNPALADHLLTPVTGPLAPLDDSLAAEVRDLRRTAIANRRTH